MVMLWKDGSSLLLLSFISLLVGHHEMLHEMLCDVLPHHSLEIMEAKNL
jgi:hypothetical protein